MRTRSVDRASARWEVGGDGGASASVLSESESHTLSAGGAGMGGGLGLVPDSWGTRIARACPTSAPRPSRPRRANAGSRCLPPRRRLPSPRRVQALKGHLVFPGRFEYSYFVFRVRMSKQLYTANTTCKTPRCPVRNRLSEQRLMTSRKTGTAAPLLLRGILSRAITAPRRPAPVGEARWERKPRENIA